MIKQNKVFDKSTISILNKMIGCTMTKIVHDEFTFTNSVYGVVSFYIGDNIFNLTNELEKLNCYGENEEVSILHLSQVDKNQVKSLLNDTKQVETKIAKVITGIDILIDTIHVEVEKEIYDNTYVKGIIFHFENDEIAFEKTDSFTEMIGVYKGYNLVEKFTDINEIKNQFSKAKNVETKREIMKIK